MTTSRLVDLPVRPPTPPRDTHQDKASGTIHSTAHLAFAPQSSLETPDDLPQLLDDSPKLVKKGAKRVGFLLDCAETEHQGPITKRAGPHEALPTSSNLGKPMKSILKQPINQQYSNLPKLLDNSGDYCDLPRMLEEVIRLLASADPSARLDAYLSFNGCLKAYQNLPSQDALEERIPLLLDFVRRDLVETMTRSGLQNSKLRNECVKLVTTLVVSPDTRDLLPDSFRSFIINHSIASITDPKSSKALANQYLFLLARQSFRSKIMNSDRANRLLSALKDIHTEISGNQVVCHRLNIYKRLISQAQALMIARSRDWLDHLFSSLLSDTTEVRSQAVSLGLEAGLQLGKNKDISRVVRDIFNEQFAETGDQRYADIVLSRLEDRVAHKEAEDVPQIWIVIVLLLRSQSRQFERWEYGNAWLKLEQQCLNSSNSRTKSNAHKAWNQFIMVVNPDATTGSRLTSLLRAPILHQLDRCRSGLKHTSSLCHATYCSLLYYAFRPGQDTQALSRFWNEYGVSVLSMAPEPPKIGFSFACQVLLALLGKHRQKPWIRDRVSQSEALKPEDIPRLDPQWVRSNADQVAMLLEGYLTFGDWQVLDNREAPIAQIWSIFTKTLAEAANKEIKTSMASMTAIAAIMGSLKRFWVKGNSGASAIGVCDQSLQLKKLSYLLSTAVTSLGTIPFVEKRLIPLPTDYFQAAETPSTRYAGDNGNLTSALAHLVELLASSVEDQNVDEAYKRIVEDIISIAMRSATSRESKVRILRDFSHSTVSKTHPAPKARTALLVLILQSLTGCITMSRSEDNNSETSQNVGQGFREALKVMEIGTWQNDAQATSLWITALRAVEVQARQEAGIAGSAIVVIEPIASSLHQRASTGWTSCLLSQSLALFDLTAWPESRKEIDRAQRVLWDAVAPASKKNEFNPYNHLYKLLDHALSKTYSSLDSRNSAEVVQLISCVHSLLASCPLTLRTIFLTGIQAGLSYWLTDPAAQMNANSTCHKLLFAKVRQLWSAVIGTIRGLPKVDSQLLVALSPLLTAALSSRHRALANDAIQLWNFTFGSADGFEYPEDIRKVLLRLNCVTEIHLPGISLGSVSEETDSTPFEYIESPEDIDGSLEGNASLAQIRPKGHILQVGGSLECLERPLDLPSVSKIRPQRASLKSASTARLRHNDSQIAFDIIESSAPNPEDITAPILTARQREMRERENTVAGLFPDLRSSSSAKPKERVSPRLKNRQARSPVHTSFPISPFSDDLAFLGSSPTPSSRRSQRKERTIGELVSSSPPATPPPYKGRHADYSIPLGVEWKHGPDPFEITRNISEQILEHTSTPNSKLLQDPNRTGNDLRLSALHPPECRSEMGIRSEDHVIATGPPSDTDERVASQISGDLEKALSQAAESPAKNFIPSSLISDSKKRKRTIVAQDSSQRKRGRGRPRKEIHVRGKETIPAPDAEIDDCIVLATDPHSQSQDKAPLIIDVTPVVTTVGAWKRRRPSLRQTPGAEDATQPSAIEAGSEVVENAQKRQRLTGKPRKTPCKTTNDSLQPQVIVEVDSRGEHEHYGTGEAAKSASQPHYGGPEEGEVSGLGILARLKGLLGDAKRVFFAGEGREVISTWLDLGRELHEAERRSG